MKVSVFLTTHNGSRTISRAINSVRAQSFSEFEFIFIDDASNDDTFGIIHDYSRMDPRVRVYRQECQLGIIHNRNLGLRLAQGEYIAPIDDDDIWLAHDKLEKQVEFLDEQKSYSLVGTGCIMIDTKGNEIVRYIPPLSDKHIRKVLLGKCVFMHSSVMFRCEEALKLGGYGINNLDFAEDYALWLKLGTVTKLANLPFFSAKITVSPNSFSSKYNFSQIKASSCLALKFRKNYNNFYFNYFKRFLGLLIYGILKVSPYNANRMTLYKMAKKILPQKIA